MFNLFHTNGPCIGPVCSVHRSRHLVACVVGTSWRMAILLIFALADAGIGFHCCASVIAMRIQYCCIADTCLCLSHYWKKADIARSWLIDVRNVTSRNWTTYDAIDYLTVNCETSWVVCKPSRCYKKDNFIAVRLRLSFNLAVNGEGCCSDMSLSHAFLRKRSPDWQPFVRPLALLEAACARDTSLAADRFYVWRSDLLFRGDLILSLHYIYTAEFFYDLLRRSAYNDWWLMWYTTVLTSANEWWQWLTSVWISCRLVWKLVCLFADNWTENWVW